MKTNKVTPETPQTGTLANIQAYNWVAQPQPVLRSLDWLVDTRWVAGPAILIQVTVEWVEGGFSLMQHIDFNPLARRVEETESTAYRRGSKVLRAGTDYQPDQDLPSDHFDNAGNSFAYAYLVNGDTLTIWADTKVLPCIAKASHNGPVNAAE